MSGQTLPEDLSRWVRQQSKSLAEGKMLVSPVRPLHVQRDDRRLEVRFNESPGQLDLLLTEARGGVVPETLERFSLTRRETEVFGWVLEGKNNPEIAMILRLSRAQWRSICRTF